MLTLTSVLNKRYYFLFNIHKIIIYFEMVFIWDGGVGVTKVYQYV